MTFAFAKDFYAELHPFCLARLQESFNQQTQLFDLRLHDRVWGTVEGTENSSSTAMVLIALHRASINPENWGIDVPRVLDALIELHKQPEYYETLGLLAWVNAILDGVPYSDILRRLGLSLEQLPDMAQPLKSSEVAWLVSGLSHEYKRSQDPQVLAVLQRMLTLLEERQHSQSALFYHGVHKAALSMRIRRHVGTFADQIYGVQAFSFAHILFGNPDYLQRAERCAARIVELQGDLGQWWWHYDARTGNVLQAYPVYSVHQHGMAPMGLLALAAAGGSAHTEAMRLSHAWQDNNEINAAMTDREVGTMWRDVEYDEGRWSRLQRKASSVIGRSADCADNQPRLKIRYDTWPYEWGWCLYAEALAFVPVSGPHLV